MTQFIGIDGARAGWILLVLDEQGVSHHLVPALADALPLLQTATVALIDMPIGIVGEGIEERRVDPKSRKLLGPRSSSVFPMPCREALAESAYPEASAVNFQVSGRKLSKQTWNIMPKIDEVDVLVRMHSHIALKESHPEVCFTGLNQMMPMPHNKKTSEGFTDRLRVLKRYLPNARAAFNAVRKQHTRSMLADDDIIDAMVLAVTARRGHAQGFESVLGETQLDPLGLPMDVVYAN